MVAAATRPTAPFSTRLGVLVAGIVVLVAVASAVAGSAGGDPNPPATLDAVVSTADGTRRVATTTLDVTPLADDEPAQITVDPDEHRQDLHGVGASLTDASAHLLAGLPDAVRSDVLHTLFDPSRGGMSVVRLVIGPSDFSRTFATLDDSDTPDPTLAKFSIDHDRTEIIPVAREILAINPDVTFIASSWSAPAWMKDTDNILYGRLRPEYEGVYADYLTRFLTEYRAEGIPVSRISVQNEPAVISLDMPSMVMDTDQQVRVTELLSDRIHTAGLDTGVLVWDHNWCSAVVPGGCGGPAPPQGALDVLAATAGVPGVVGTALHCYGGDQVTANRGLHDAWSDREIWQTECSGGDWNGPRAQAFAGVADMVVKDRANWSTGTLFWNLALDPSGGPHNGGCGDCRGVVTVDPDTATWFANVEFDVAATTARFAPAGSTALGTEVVDAPRGLVASAACTPGGRVSLLIWNPGAAATVTVRVGTSGFAVPVEAATLLALPAPEETTCLDDTPSTTIEPPQTSQPVEEPPATVPDATVPDASLPVVTTAPDTTVAARGSTSVPTAEPWTSSPARHVGDAPRVATPAAAVGARPTYTG